MLEGGGQLVRSAVALSALSGTPVTITAIRAKREKPGLAAQHVAAVNAVAGTCNAETEGVFIGSREIVFRPGSPARSDLSVDVGTAGSIPLVIQAWLPVALHAGGSITVTGGTETDRSPTIDYLDRVFAAALRAHGAGITITIHERGYYPRGGGRVTATAGRSAIRRIDMRAVRNDCGIVSCTGNLPDHVAPRQAEAAARELSGVLPGPLPAGIDRRSGPSTGSSITAWSGWKGGSAVGRRGWPAEEVGKAAGGMLARELAHRGTVDTHLADQLLVYLARYGGEYTTGECTLHAVTMCRLLSQFGYGADIKRDGITEFSS